ncbi:MAG: MoaD/ThiS family protein [Rivularia sp. ALOHA_DT_140]|nr:MoaD/ThiS family protein [Rivularia sp. ALOHA_DT_140]
MNVTVNYLAQLKQAVRISSENIVLENPCSVQELVTQVAEKHGEPLRSFLLSSTGSLSNSILVLVGDNQIHWNQPMPGKEGDVISLMSPIAGG